MSDFSEMIAQAKMHKCAAVDCTKRAPGYLLMCLRHWQLVPPQIRRSVWYTHEKADQRAHLVAIKAAIKAVALKEGKNGRL